MNRIRMRGAGSYPLTAEAIDAEGAKVAVSEPATITIQDGAGATATSGVPSISDGELAFDASAIALDKLDTYRAIWTGEVAGVAQEWETSFELVGGFLCSIADIRTFDVTSGLDDTTKYSTAAIATARTIAEEVLETNCMVAFVPRGARKELSGDGTSLLILPDILPREIYSVTVGGTALTEAELAELIIHEYGGLERPSGKVWTASSRNVVVHYAHGMDAPPEAVVRAALFLAVDRALQTTLPSRAISISTDLGVIRNTLAGRDGATGIPEVDAVIAQFGHRRPRVG